MQVLHTGDARTVEALPHWPFIHLSLVSCPTVLEQRLDYDQRATTMPLQIFGVPEVATRGGEQNSPLRAALSTRLVLKCHCGVMLPGSTLASLWAGAPCVNAARVASELAEAPFALAAEGP